MINRRQLTILLVFTLLTASAFGFLGDKSMANSQETLNGLSNPVTSNGVTTWDTVYFGNYYQNDTNGDGKANQEDEKQPIRWRVLSINGDDVFLMADQNLELRCYYDEKTGECWAKSTLRSWLNTAFINEAFNKVEQETIVETQQINDISLVNGDEESDRTTIDKLYLLSIYEVENPAYGFHDIFEEESETRQAYDTAYVRDCETRTDSDIRYKNKGCWWLRSCRMSNGYKAAVIRRNGEGSWHTYISQDIKEGVRPVMHISMSRLKASGTQIRWSIGSPVNQLIGKGCYDTPNMDVTPEQVPDNNDKVIKNPQIVNETVTWDTLYFGYYYQNDNNGDGIADEYDSKEPIRWRVLSVNGNDAFLVSDMILDRKPYNEAKKEVFWADCTLRKWLNNTFYNMAFNNTEKMAMKDALFLDEEEKKVNVIDKVRLLTTSELTNRAYGFDEDYSIWSKTRIATKTGYANPFSTEGGCWWVCVANRSQKSGPLMVGTNQGNIAWLRGDVSHELGQVRPAMRLDLSNTSLWKKGKSISTRIYPPSDDDSDYFGVGKRVRSTKKKIKKPARAKVIQMKNKGKRKLYIKLKKISGAKGYQLQYATNKKFKKAKKKLTRKTKITIKKLKKKTYYLRARAYKANGKKKVFGKWSGVKKVRIKK